MIGFDLKIAFKSNKLFNDQLFMSVIGVLGTSPMCHWQTQENVGDVFESSDSISILFET